MRRVVLYTEKMNTHKIVLLLFFTFVSINSFAQKWVSDTINILDTSVIEKIYLNDNLVSENKVGIHKKVYKSINNRFYSLEYFNLKGLPIENENGIHKEVKYWKYSKFFNKEGVPLKRVKEYYWHEFSDAEYRIFEYDKKGNLISLSYFKNEYDKVDSNREIDFDNPTFVPTGKSNLEADAHKITWSYKKKKGLVIQKTLNADGNTISTIKLQFKDFK